MKNKKFDCVKMKHDIQREIMAEFQDLADEEQWAILEKQILADPILGPIWRNTRTFDPNGLDQETSLPGAGDEGKRESP